MTPYPLKCVPIFKERIWGGQTLETVFGKALPAGEKIGESWELADLPHDKTVIANGELAGRTLASVVERYPQEIAGIRNFPGPFPLLVKLLDARDVLSVQVHPDAETCRRMGRASPRPSAGISSTPSREPSSTRASRSRSLGSGSPKQSRTAP